MESLNRKEGGPGKLNVAVVVDGKARAENNDGNSKRGLASANDETRGQFMLSELRHPYIQIIVILNHR